MNGFLAGVGEYGSTRFLALTLFVIPHLHQRSRAIARRIALRNWPAEANVERHRIRWTDSSAGRYCAKAFSVCLRAGKQNQVAWQPPAPFLGAPLPQAG